MVHNVRLDYLDNLKGFLIVCVVLGHSIQFSSPNFDNVPLFRFIYSFHMPLFMWVSGYVNYRVETKLGLLKRRAVQLALPFVAWVSLHSAIRMDLHHWIDVICNPTVSVWFIWDLFLMICFTTCVSYWSEKYRRPALVVTLIAYVFMQVGIKACHTEFLGISHALDLGWFYLLGFYMKKYDVFGKYMTGGVIFLLFLIGCLFWQRKQPPTFLPDGGKVVMLAYKMIVACLACVSIPLLFKRFLNMNIKILTYLGQQTLGIYVIHMSVIFYVIGWFERYSGLGNAYLNYAGITIITLAISQIVNVLLQKNRWTNLIFLGKK